MFVNLTSLLDAIHAHFTSHNVHFFPGYYVRGDTDDHGRSLNATPALSWALLWPRDTTWPGPTGLDLWRPPSGHPAAARAYTPTTVEIGSRRAIARDAPAALLAPPCSPPQPPDARGASPGHCARHLQPLARLERPLIDLPGRKCSCGSVRRAYGKGGSGRKSGDRAGSRGRSALFGGPVARP